MHNIYYAQGWCVKKQIDGEIIHFGFFKELEEAKAHRDYCEANNWDVEKCKLIRRVRSDG